MGKIYLSGTENGKLVSTEDSYQKHFLDQNNSDPNNLFKKSFSPARKKKKVFLSKKNNGFLSNPLDDSNKHKNLKLYLPQIDNENPPQSRSTSEIMSRGRW